MPTVRDQEQPGNVNGSGFGSALRVLAALSVTAVAAALVFMAWGSTETATSEVHGKIFLVGWAVAAVVIAAGFLITDLASRPRGLAAHAVSSLTAQHLAVGFVVGLAIGTTDWETLRLAGWWQFWWTGPLLLAYGGLLGRSRRSSRAAR